MLVRNYNTNNGKAVIFENILVFKIKKHLYTFHMKLNYDIFLLTMNKSYIVKFLFFLFSFSILSLRLRVVINHCSLMHNCFLNIVSNNFTMIVCYCKIFSKLLSRYVTTKSSKLLLLVHS